MTDNLSIKAFEKEIGDTDEDLYFSALIEKKKLNFTKSIEILEFDSIDVDIDVSVLGVRVVSHERNNSNNHTTQETVNSNRFQQHIQIRAAGQMLGLKSNTLLPSQLNLEFDYHYLTNPEVQFDF